MDSNNTKMSLPDKVKKMKNGLKLHTYKDVSENKGKEAETKVIEKDGKALATYETKDGKTLGTSATMDAQKTGVYEDNAKAGGVKKEDITYTAPTLRGAEAGVAANKDKSKDNDQQAEKAKLLGKGEMEKTEWKVPGLVPKVADKDKMKKASVDNKKIEPPSAAAPSGKSPTNTDPSPAAPKAAGPAAPAKKEAPTLDYSKMQKPQDQSWHWKNKWKAKPEQEKRQFMQHLAQMRMNNPKPLSKSDEQAMPKDDDSKMAMSELAAVMHHLEEIKAKMNPNKDMPDEMDVKISEAADRLACVAHYLDSHKQAGEGAAKPEPKAEPKKEAMEKSDDTRAMCASKMGKMKSALQKGVGGKTWGEAIGEGQMPQVNPKLVSQEPTHEHKGMKVKHLKELGNGHHAVEIMDGVHKGKWTQAHESEMKPLNKAAPAAAPVAHKVVAAVKKEVAGQSGASKLKSMHQALKPSNQE